MWRATLVFLLLAGCSEFPPLEGTISPEVADAPFLDFLSPDELAAIGTPAPVATEDPLASRLLGLKARAEALRGPVFTAGDRARLSGSPG
ncbi:MAG: hypothetical protein AAF618_10730 [Pseudomonadota bacterium]